MSKSARKSTGANMSRPKDQSCNFNESDRRQLQQIYTTVTLLKDELKNLKTELAESKATINAVKAENSQLKQALNLTNYKLDSLEQYGRRENIQIHNIPETLSNKDDGEEKVLKIANELNIDLTNADIQRAHRLGTKKRNGKPRPIIIRFQSFKKRNEFLFRKSGLKSNNEFKYVFIAEDLTPIRAKLLRYLKNECDNDFVQIHTINGKIRFKKSAVKEGLPLDENGKDPGTGNWLTVTSPDDLFKVGVDIDFTKFSYPPLNYNVEVDKEASLSLMR